MPRKSRKRLSVDVPVAIHNEVKAIAVKHNITITRLVIRLLIELIQFQKEDK